MEKKKKNISNIINVILSILIVSSMELSLSPSKVDFLFSYNNKLYLSFVFFAIYELLKKLNISKINIKQAIFSFILSTLNLVSYYYYNYNSIHNMYQGFCQIFKSAVYILGGTVVTYLIIHIVYNILIKIKYTKSKNNIINLFFEKRPMLFTGVTILLTYFIFLLFVYPGICCGDTIDEIRQYNHVMTWSVNYINLIDQSIYINGHHSPFHTIIIGYIFNLFSNAKVGFFVNCIIQLVLVTIILSYTFNTMKKMKTPYILRIIILLIYLFLPSFLCGSVTLIKDIPFSILILLYCCLLIEYFVLKEKSVIKTILLLIIPLLISLFSNKGIYLIIFTTIMMLFHYKDNKKIIIFSLIPITLYFGYSKMLLPSLHVTSGSPREMLTIPIQQISRVVVNYDSKLSKNDKKTINEIINYDEIKNYYNPQTVDPIKNNLFDKNYTKREMKEFLKLWLDLGLKYPKVYINAFLNQVYGYFYIEKSSAMAYYDIKFKEEANDNLAVELQNTNPKINEKIKRVFMISRRIPLFGLLMSVAFYNWTLILMIMYVLFYKKIKYLLPFIPPFVIFVFCFVSPVSGNFRYILPIIYSMPILLCYMSYLMHLKKVR